VRALAYTKGGFTPAKLPHRGRDRRECRATARFSVTAGRLDREQRQQRQARSPEQQALRSRPDSSAWLVPAWPSTSPPVIAPNRRVIFGPQHGYTGLHQQALYCSAATGYSCSTGGGVSRRRSAAGEHETSGMLRFTAAIRARTIPPHAVALTATSGAIGWSPRERT
jgi:hypothetical protein